MQRFFEPDGRPDTGSDHATSADVALAVNGMGTFTWDVTDGVMRYDDAGLAVMGFRPGEFDGRLETLSERMVAEELPAIQELVDRALRERSGFSLYFRVRHRNGRLRWTHTQGHIVRDPQWRPVRVIGVIRDASQELVAFDQTEQLRQARNDRRRQADIVGHVSDVLVPTVTVEDVAEALTTSRLLERIGASGIVLGLIDNGRMELVGSNGVPENLIRDFHLSRLDATLPLTEAVRTRKPVFLTSKAALTERYPALEPYVTRFSGTVATAYLPLIAQDTPIGAVGLTYAGGARFPPDERTVLTALGRVIAQSLQRALLYDQEHELAAGLQTAMLPGRLPQVPELALATRYRPTRARGGIGGDWYDALTLPDGRIVAVVGDVQGHDVTAAAVMGQLRIALSAYAAEGHPPATVMARASAFLAELDTDRFATCLIALLDPGTGMTSIVRAGHPEPVLRRRDGSSVWIATPGGLPLGLTAPGTQPAYPALETVLEPGSTLVLCTDGLIESRARDIDQGRTRLLDAITTGPGPPEVLADHLLDTMAAYTGEEDDVALLVLQRSRSGPDPAPQMEATISPADPDALGAARLALRTALHAWSLEALDDTAELLACELATNALLHTGGHAILTARPVRHGGRGLRLAVSDASPVTPRRRAANEQCTSGRGLMLVEELATSWGIEPRGTGKTVWCEISLNQL
ncbi:magnesium or manganese-dependent protein phosphatase [Streptomyces viridiviolaceus]|uniref:SpoIIE family protein phosphatase n=1 Tax=Streptomyces viridiviolaceus TaxID=68282 RepID=A0ABW2E8W1_9ACTN|nr:SpoIIE family protein phosphatase [Streptomyces viridiviolaceus]GHB45362.1 magnesium or manganese-dependent protein phosphatase [Streptomyces viridiviolaceus]